MPTPSPKPPHWPTQPDHASTPPLPSRRPVADAPSAPTPHPAKPASGPASVTAGNAVAGPAAHVRQGHEGWSEALIALTARGEVRRYRKGTLLIQEGDHGDTLFVILEGRLRAFSADDGDREITYGVYGPGEYLGEMSLDGGPRSASVITLEPSTCAVIGRRTLERFIAERPEFAFELMGKLIRRARAATLNARQLALNDVYGRLRGLLIATAAPEGDDPAAPRPITERLTHQAMAHRLGCSREMVSRLMKDLERGGYVRGQRGDLELLRPLPQRW